MQIYLKKDMTTLTTYSIIDPELHALFLKKTPFTKDPEAWKKNNPEDFIHEFSYRNHLYIALYFENTLAITHAGHCHCIQEPGKEKTQSGKGS